MALVIKSNGEVLQASPSNNKYFQLEELQSLVGGYIEILRVWYNNKKRLMIVDDEGKLKEKPINRLATKIYNAPDEFIVGDVVIIKPEEIK